MKRIMLSLIIGSLAISPAFAESRNQERQIDAQEHSRTSDDERENLRDSNAQGSEYGIQGGATRLDKDIGRSTTRIHRDTGE